MKRLIFAALTELTRTSATPIQLVVTFFGAIWLRVMMESFLPGNQMTVYPLFIVYEFIHFFLLLFILNALFTLILVKIVNFTMREAMTLVVTIFLPFILIPPLIDAFVFSQYDIVSYYEYYSAGELFVNFFTFMHQDPLIGTTPGQRITFALALITLIPFVYHKVTYHKVRKTVATVFLAYCSLYFIVTIPSTIVLLLDLLPFGTLRQGITAIGSSDIFTFFAAPLISPSSLIAVAGMHISHFKMILILFVFDLIVLCAIAVTLKRDLFITLLKNIRPVQVLYHLGLLALGLALGFSIQGYGFFFTFYNALLISVLAIAVVLAWYGSVVFNDFFDQKTDRITNATRPLITKVISPRHYLLLGVFFLVLSSGIAFFLSSSIGVLMLTYHCISLIYSTPPLRLKRLPIIATAIGSFASLTVVFIGYALATPSRTLEDFPLPIVLLLFLVHLLCLPIKDLKDESGDRADNVWTLPVLVGQKRARIIIALNLFISYMLSVVLLRVYDMFLLAFTCSIICFWSIVLRKNIGNKKVFVFEKQRLLLMVFIPAAFYVLSVVRSIVS